jgi:hypothetical protein
VRSAWRHKTAHRQAKERAGEELGTAQRDIEHCIEADSAPADMEEGSDTEEKHGTEEEHRRSSENTSAAGTEALVAAKLAAEEGPAAVGRRPHICHTHAQGCSSPYFSKSTFLANTQNTQEHHKNGSGACCQSRAASYNEAKYKPSCKKEFRKKKEKLKDFFFF